MTVNECMESGVVTVKYVMPHTNHHTNLSECKHLPLPKCVVDKVRLQLAKCVVDKVRLQLASGVKIERVLDGKCIMLRLFLLDIRSDLSSRSKRKYFMDTVQRRHFITRQDCRNIGRKLNNFSRQRHADDAISVDRIVQCEMPSPVLAYKEFMMPLMIYQMIHFFFLL